MLNWIQVDGIKMKPDCLLLKKRLKKAGFAKTTLTPAQNIFAYVVSIIPLDDKNADAIRKLRAFKKAQSIVWLTLNGWGTGSIKIRCRVGSVRKEYKKQAVKVLYKQTGGR